MTIERIPKRREKWPMEFDIEGVSRDLPTRTEALRELKGAQMPDDSYIDINKPPQLPYRYQEFPKLTYNHETGAVLKVDDEKEAKAAEKRGFQAKPSTKYDYSRIRNGFAVPHGTPEPKQEEPAA